MTTSPDTSPRPTRADGNTRRPQLRTHARLFLMGLRPKLRRGFDILVAGAALIYLGPLLAAIALLVRITSKGPVLFKQERIGQFGRRFYMLKFRTMYADAERLKAILEKQSTQALSGVRFKLKRDPRITPLGRVIRKLSIDELPQLWNVLSGDMSLIGPRPAIQREVSLYDDQALRRLEVPQGLTCWWQVKGRSDLSFEQQVELDIEYVDHAKSADDVRILLKTIPAVISGKGAY